MSPGSAKGFEKMQWYSKNNTPENIKNRNERMCLGCVTPCRRDMTSRREEQRTVEKWESSVDRDKKLCQRCPKKTKKMSKEHNGQRKDTWDFNNFVRGIFVFKVWSEIGT